MGVIWVPVQHAAAWLLSLLITYNTRAATLNLRKMQISIDGAGDVEPAFALQRSVLARTRIAISAR